MSHVRCALVLILSLFAFSTTAAADESGFVSMFNGTDLTGWEGQPEWWSVQDGLLTAESTTETPCTRSDLKIRIDN